MIVFISGSFIAHSLHTIMLFFMDLATRSVGGAKA